MGVQTLKDYGPVQTAERLGMSRGTWERALTAGVVPAPDVAGHRWSAAVVDGLVGRAAALLEEVGEPPVGATRAAEELAERTGLPVIGADVEVLAERALVAERGEFKGWPLYDRRDLAAVDAGAVAAVVAEREAWLAGGCSRWEAAERLGWRVREFDQVARQRASWNATAATSGPRSPPWPTTPSWPP
jgi:hypothetical protein